MSGGAAFHVDLINGFWYEKHQPQHIEGPSDIMKQLKELLFELSAKLISVPPSDIGREIENGLKLIGEYWDFDRITLTEFADDTEEVRITHSYTASGIPQAPLGKIAEGIPWIIDRLQLGEKLLLSSLPDDLPEEAKTDRRYCIKEDLKSALALPVKIGPSTLGGLFLASLHRQRKWDSESVRELYYLAEILASALERMRAAEQINELMLFEHLLYEISATYINLPRDQYDKVIKNDLGRVGRLQLGRFRQRFCPPAAQSAGSGCGSGPQRTGR